MLGSGAVVALLAVLCERLVFTSSVTHRRSTIR